MAKQHGDESQSEPSAIAIARLNDALRANITSPGANRVVMTAGVAALIGDTSLFAGFHKHATLLRLVRDFDGFTPANDPHREHDLGKFEFEDTRCLWKIDYYDTTLTGGSENAADPRVTVRVLTILRGDEW
jgi:hypothetical protein